MKTTLLATLMLVVAIHDVPAQVSITSVEPLVVTTGTEITITGSGFGEKTPKVVLASLDGSKPKGSKLKVVSASEGLLIALVKKASAGNFSLAVEPKGGGQGAPAASHVVVSVSAPTDVDVPGDVVATNSEIVIGAQHLGTKKGKVRIGGKKAKVIEWTPSVGAPDAGGIVVRVPKSLSSGSHVVEVSNTVGSASSSELLSVDNPAPVTAGKPTFMCSIDGATFATKGKKKVGYETGLGCFGDGCVTLGGLKGKKAVILFIDDYHPLLDGPTTISPYDAWIAVETKALSFEPCISRSSWPTIEITHVDAEGRVSGSFSATDFSIVTGDTLLAETVTNGTFTNVPWND